MKFYTVNRSAAARDTWPDRVTYGPISEREMTRGFLANASGWHEKEDVDVLAFVGKLVELDFVTVVEIDLMKLARTIAGDAEALTGAGFTLMGVTVPRHYALGMGYESRKLTTDNYSSRDDKWVWDDYSEGVPLTVEDIGDLPSCGYRLLVSGRA